jgi:hypothetical protein
MKAVFRAMALNSPKSSYIEVGSYFPPSFADKNWVEHQEDFFKAVTYIIRYVMLLGFLSRSRVQFLLNSCLRPCIDITEGRPVA